MLLYPFHINGNQFDEKVMVFQITLNGFYIETIPGKNIDTINVIMENNDGCLKTHARVFSKTIYRKCT